MESNWNGYAFLERMFVVPKDNKTPHQAGDYDLQIKKTIPFYEFFHEETIRLVQSLESSPKRWLDTGCGTGTLVAKALSSFPDTRFILADPSESMLLQAKAKLIGANRPIVFIESTGSEDLRGKVHERVDVITAISAHHYLSREGRRQAVEACFELLNPGGLFITFENIRPLTSDGITLGQRSWAGFQVDQGKTPEAAAQHMKRFDTEYFPITILEHLQLLKDAGFKSVEMLWYSRMQAGFFAIK